MTHFDLSLAWNDDQGRFQHVCDAIEVTLPGCEATWLQLSTWGLSDGWACARDATALTLGSVRLAYTHYGPHVGSLIWDRVRVSAATLARLLAVLQAAPAWSFDTGIEPLSEAYLGLSLDAAQWQEVLEALGQEVRP